MAISWWASELEARLSQGDLIDENVFALARHPLVALVKTSWNGKSAFKESEWSPDTNGACDVLAAGRKGIGLVLTHSCELDKERARGRVIVCPAVPMTSIPAEQRPEVYVQKPWAKMPLPAVPGKGDYVADLKFAITIDRRILDAASRVASMTREARLRLRMQLIAFYTRLDPSQYADAMPDDDADPEA